MEPSTSREQRNVRPVFQKEDVIRMLLNQDDDVRDVDDEPFYENSGSENEQSEPDSDSCHEESRSRSRSRSPTLDLSQPPAKKKKATTRSRSKSTQQNVSTSKSKSCKRKRESGPRSRPKSRSTNRPVENNDSGSDIDVDADFEVIGAPSVSAPRALFYTENDDVAHREVAAPIADDKWAPPPPDFVPSIPEFTADAGIQVPYDNFLPADFASLFFFTHEFWTLLVTETNRMADQFYQARPQLGNCSIFHGWEPVDIPEMRKFIGIILLSGLVYKSAMRSFWTSDPLTSTPAFSALMKRDRFEQIMKFFHFNNNAYEPPHTANERDGLYKIRPLLEQLSTSFRNAFTPEKEICIDESLMLYKDRVIFRQYMPLKWAQFGIRIFCLTDKNEYLHSFSVYTGKQDPLYNVDS
ncbi:PiggyBac transposase Uribo2 [Elysia marginata]|uniref:PiggyBac transposase Uribo2 n=1 Tax=Elysia marginata TaxID=1093978 RepID=A0AAV4EWH7_9GAST|nr:PiggyBac transposase Uribo2 [Elysia marginata]